MATKLMTQHFLECKLATKEQLEVKYKSICNKLEIDALPVETLVENINNNLSKFSFEIKKTFNPKTGAVSFCLVNSMSDDLTVFATDLTIHEINYFKKVLSLIVSSGTFTCKSSDLLKSTGSLTKRDSEALIGIWAQNEWLSEIARYYFLI